jgi:hypothetical protein
LHKIKLQTRTNRGASALLVALFLFAQGVFFYAPKALANTGSAVGGPNVDAGKTAVEWRLAASEDDDASQDKRVRTRVHIDHAFSDLYAARLVYNLDRRKGDNFEFDGLSLQNRFHILKAKDHGFDGGIRLNYTFADGDKKPDVLSLRFYQRIPHDAWEVRFNQIFESEIGEDRDGGLIAEWRTQVTYGVTEDVRLGLDFFHDLGNLEEQSGYSSQEHAAGPVLKAKFGGGYSIEAAYRIGLSDAAPDQSGTFILTRSW